MSTGSTSAQSSKEKSAKKANEQHTSDRPSRRRKLARSEHSTWNPKLRHRQPPELLGAAARGRLPHLLALKNELMAESPFGFFRGAVPMMAYDLSLLPNTGLLTQLCGDAHVRNLGAYAGPDGGLLFDINDFDETIRGPFEWDVKRLTASILLAGQAAHVKSFACEEAASSFLLRYRKSIRNFAAMPVLELARFRVHRLDRSLALSDVLAKAERATPLRNLDSLTESTTESTRPGKNTKSAKKADRSHAASSKESRSGEPLNSSRHTKHLPQRRFRSEPPHLVRLAGKEAEAILDALPLYRKSLEPQRRHFLDRYRPVDVAFKVVGTGSVGLRDYCVYLEGNGPADPLFLQVKQEVESAWSPYVTKGHGARPSTAIKHQGQRVVEGQRTMQLESDPFLGWTTIDRRDFLVRQLNDHKSSIAIEDLTPAALVDYAELCGELLARGHARSGEPGALYDYIGNSDRFDEAVLRFGTAYAEQTERDWKTFTRGKKK